MIIQYDSGEDGGITNEELIDQIAFLFFEDRDTTSNTLNFLLNYLARNPLVLEKLRKIMLNKFPRGINDILEES